jgi:Flp pilus assembly protein TadD/TolB-like protein
MRAFPPRLRLRQLAAPALACALAVPGFCLAAQTSPDSAADHTLSPRIAGKLLLVLPFENRTGQSSLDWIGDAVPEILNQRLQSAGFQLIGRGDRQYALEHLGLPRNFQPSRATALRLAQTLDADYVVSGFYRDEGQNLQATAQILDVGALRLDPPLKQQAEMSQLLTILNSLAWRVARTLDPQYPVPETAFDAEGARIRLDGFENYIRGLDEADAAERIRHLRQAVEQNPHYAPAWLALGDEYFGDQQFEQAEAALGHLPRNDPGALRAEFYRGLAFFYTGNYAKAEDAFAYVATQLPLAEVLNNRGVALSRRGRDGVPYFQRAIAADPHDPDYSFNLAVSLARRHDLRDAQAALQQALKLRPADSEAQAFSATLKTLAASNTPAPPAPQPASQAIPTAVPQSADSAPNLPLERIKRNFNDASFRQAAAAMEAMEAQRIAALPPSGRADALTREGDRYLNEGLLLEAEREFQLALAADTHSSGAHAGLAAVRERDGEVDSARTEARASLALQPNAPAYVVLAKLDIAAHQLSAATTDVNEALRLDPSNPAARSLKGTIQAAQTASSTPQRAAP